MNLYRYPSLHFSSNSSELAWILFLAVFGPVNVHVFFYRTGTRGYLIHCEVEWLLALITPADPKAKDSQSQVHQNQPWSAIHLHVWKADGGRKIEAFWDEQHKNQYVLSNVYTSKETIPTYPEA